jgi:hypothetical protein
VISNLMFEIRIYGNACEKKKIMMKQTLLLKFLIGCLDDLSTQVKGINIGLEKLARIRTHAEELRKQEKFRTSVTHESGIYSTDTTPKTEQGLFDPYDSSIINLSAQSWGNLDEFISKALRQDLPILHQGNIPQLPRLIQTLLPEWFESLTDKDFLFPMKYEIKFFELALIRILSKHHNKSIIGTLISFTSVASDVGTLFFDLYITPFVRQRQFTMLLSKYSFTTIMEEKYYLQLSLPDVPSSQIKSFFIGVVHKLLTKFTQESPQIIPDWIVFQFGKCSRIDLFRKINLFLVNLKKDIINITQPIGISIVNFLISKNVIIELPIQRKGKQNEMKCIYFNFKDILIDIPKVLPYIGDKPPKHESVTVQENNITFTLTHKHSHLHANPDFTSFLNQEAFNRISNSFSHQFSIDLPFTIDFFSTFKTNISVLQSSLELWEYNIYANLDLTFTEDQIIALNFWSELYKVNILEYFKSCLPECRRQSFYF